MKPLRESFNQSHGKREEGGGRGNRAAVGALALYCIGGWQEDGGKARNESRLLRRHDNPLGATTTTHLVSSSWRVVVLYMPPIG